MPVTGMWPCARACRSSIAGGAGPACIHDHTTPPRRPVGPVRRGPFRPVDEHHLGFPWVIRDDAARRAVPGLVKHLHLAGLDVDLLDPRAVEHTVDRAYVVHDPAAVGRPDIDVCQHVAVRSMRELAFGGGKDGGPGEENSGDAEDRGDARRGHGRESVATRRRNARPELARTPVCGDYRPSARSGGASRIVRVRKPDTR